MTRHATYRRTLTHVCLRWYDRDAHPPESREHVRDTQRRQYQLSMQCSTAIISPRSMESEPQLKVYCLWRRVRTRFSEHP